MMIKTDSFEVSIADFGSLADWTGIILAILTLLCTVIFFYKRPKYRFYIREETSSDRYGKTIEISAVNISNNDGVLRYEGYATKSKFRLKQFRLLKNETVKIIEIPAGKMKIIYEITDDDITREIKWKNKIYICFSQPDRRKKFYKLKILEKR